ncbi:hypothetical protein [Clostridium fallax]|uniref:YCII-related domain-containing protein n=1 Tax=Clostridium fallax TaxID=1533 RepID=A0A1M4T6N6_9CLOT|nr:hypothetical protein [Clostridium fallax]SHE40129.1 hypothetical protein SAMN05443638_10244 [Clostridium fallax]SQB22623.1 Uncharacterised protein [Clostridium fallax]
MKKNVGIFVKINYKLDEETKKHLKNTSCKYRETNLSRYLLCGGIYNKNGGSFIFQANSLKEAENIIKNNPFVNTAYYSFEILSKNYLSLSN